MTACAQAGGWVRPPGQHTQADCYQIYNDLRKGCFDAHVACWAPLVGLGGGGIVGCIAGCGYAAFSGPIGYNICVFGCIGVDAFISGPHIAKCYTITKNCHDTAKEQKRICLETARDAAEGF